MTEAHIAEAAAAPPPASAPPHPHVQTQTMLAPALAPERIGKYYVVHEVGRGSTGVVYLSHDPFYGRDVAIKFYHATSGEDAEGRNARRMFMGEAHMVGKLQHPNIVPIFDAGEEEGRRYVVTEHIHGARTLSRTARLGSLLPIDQVVSIMYKCAKALHYAHSRGVIHRDIKPSNILLTQDGDVRIVDFGIALVADSDVSRLEGMAGSPAYMSPEQVQGLELDARSDLYSLGAVMYEMLCGQRPFRAGALGKLLRQIVQSEPESLRSVRPEIPEELEAVVNCALQKDPDARYRNGAEFAAELTRVHQKLRANQAETRRRGALRGAAQAALLPRFLARRDPRGDARGGVDGLPGGRAGAAPGRHRRPLLHRGLGHRAAEPRRRHRRPGAGRRLLRRGELCRRLAARHGGRGRKRRSRC